MMCIRLLFPFMKVFLYIYILYVTFTYQTVIAAAEPQTEYEEDYPNNSISAGEVMPIPSSPSSTPLDSLPPPTEYDNHSESQGAEIGNEPLGDLIIIPSQLQQIAS